MDGIFRALFGSKPDYAEKIPETLTAKDFAVQKTFHHGYPSQPTCLEYDSIQQLLAIGTESGAVLLLGKPGLERYFQHPCSAAVLKLQFITNRGLLVTCCSNSTLYLWSLKEHVPKVLHTLEFTRENDQPTSLSHTYNSEWLYVGTNGSNVYLVNIPTFLLSGFTVHWTQALAFSARAKPGQVLAVLEHPMDQGKILIAYNNGVCSLYNMKHHDNSQTGRSNATDSKHAAEHKVFSFDPGNNHIVTSVCWVNCGKHIACSYSDGSIVLWNSKSETKPEKVFFLHDTDTSQFKPIYKMQVMQTDGDPLFLCSGGFPENSADAPRTITITHGKSSTMISCSSTIIDFLCLRSTPHLCDHQKPFALVIIAKNEIVFHDMSTPGYPKFPSYSLPYALDIHLPAVSSIHYAPSCPEEFIAQLHSVKSKMMTTSTKPWPLCGGRWGEEVPDSSTDIVITGHVDGSVRLWHCNSVIFQPFFTVDTSRYFKRNYSESPTKSPSPTPPKRPTSQNTSPPGRPPPPSHPPPKSKRASEKNLLKVLQTASSTDEGQEAEAGEEVVARGEKSESRVAPSPVTGKASPATGQVHEVDQPSTQESTDGIERKTISYKDKKKKRKSSKSLDVTTPVDHDEGSNKVKKSFRKVAKIVKLSRSVSGSDKLVEEVDHETTTIPEVPEEEEKASEESSEASSSSLKLTTVQSTAEEEALKAQPRKKRPPPRPNAITLKSESQTGMALSPSAEMSPHNSVFTSEGEGSQEQQNRSHSRQHWSEEEESRGIKSRNSPHRLTSKLRFRPPPASSSAEEEDADFFVVNYTHLCVCGLWLCVANNGGNVMVFDFCANPSKKHKQAGFLDVNFDYDSIKKQYTPSTTPLDEMPRHSPSLKPNNHPFPSSPIWVYDDRISDLSTGYQLVQLCRCYYTTVTNSDSDSATNHTPSPTTTAGAFTPSVSSSSETRMPVAVNKIQYSVTVGLLAMATRRGLALVDTHNNTRLYTLSSCISLLYLSDPSKFTNQMKRESRMNVASRPSIKRHATSIRFNDDRGNAVRRRIQSAQEAMATSPGCAEEGSGAACEESYEISVEMESCISTLELVQLQLDKAAPPTLTLWVGLASGYVASYIVNSVKSASKRIDLVPTRILIETKSPIVSIFFLNEWGDLQVVPYKPDMTLAGQASGADKQVQRSPSQSPLTSPSTQHYAVFVDEQKIKAFSFPGLNKINFLTLPLENGNVILRSEYFTCKGLPCLATITSCQYLFIHSLPGIKFLTALPLASFGDPLTLGTFRLSGVGQGLYMSSASEIQRVSIVKDNRLNFPDCLPSVYTLRDDFSPTSGKGFLGALFSAGPSTVNREEMFGAECAKHPIGNIAKVDGQLSRAYGSRTSRSTVKAPPVGESSRRTVKGGGVRRGEGGLSGQMNRNISSLNERQVKLNRAVERTNEMADSASSYADLAARLAKKYGAK